MSLEQTKTAVPAIGYSIVANLDGNRQMTIQCFVSEDEPLKQIHKKIDRIFLVVDRQRAKYELIELRQELIKHRETLAQFEEDKANIDHKINVKLAMLDAQKATANDDYKAFHNKGAERHHNQGRKGPYEPSGAEAISLKRIQEAIKQIEKEQETVEAERKQHFDAVMISINRYNEAIANLEEKIAEREALVA